LRCLLTNPAYAGQIFANRMRTSPPQTRYSALRPVGHSKGTRRPTDVAEWIAVASVPAIIIREQFDAAAARLVYNRRMAPRNNRVHQYLLRGLVSCGCCRRACTGRRLPPAYDYYLCRTKTQLRLLVPGERCAARYIPAKPLEELVWQDLCDVLQHPEIIAQAMERARGGHWLPQEWQARRENLRRGRTSLTQQIERLTEAYLGGVVPLAEFERRRRETEGRLGALERQEQELLADARDRHETARLADHAEEFCRRIRNGLASADFERKRALLELLVDRVVVTDGEVEIRYAFPTGPDGEREPFCRLRTDYLERLVRPVCLRGILPLQAVADDVDDPADHPPIIHPRNAMGQREMRRNPRHLALTEQEQITHSEPPNPEALNHTSAQINRS
jgi:site-specific DNA recombinase